MSSFPKSSIEDIKHYMKVTEKRSLVEVIFGDPCGETFYILKKNYYRLYPLLHPDLGGNVSPTESTKNFKRCKERFRRLITCFR